MDDSVEKSCWGVTLWAILVVLGIALVSSIFLMGDQSAAIATSTVISS